MCSTSSHLHPYPMVDARTPASMTAPRFDAVESLFSAPSRRLNATGPRRVRWSTTCVHPRQRAHVLLAEAVCVEDPRAAGFRVRVPVAHACEFQGEHRRLDVLRVLRASVVAHVLELDGLPAVLKDLFDHACDLLELLSLLHVRASELHVCHFFLRRSVV